MKLRIPLKTSFIEILCSIFLIHSFIYFITVKADPDPEPDPICSLPPDTGPCKALLHRWYFKVDVEQCREFVWGGCAGNENKFNTKKECQRKCLRKYVVGAEEVGPDINPTVVNKERHDKHTLSYRLPIDPEEKKGKNFKGSKNQLPHKSSFGRSKSRKKSRSTKKGPKSKKQSIRSYSSIHAPKAVRRTQQKSHKSSRPQQGSYIVDNNRRYKQF